MYYKNFVSCIKVNGKVLREQNSEVAIPFNSEYSLLLKNLNSVRAQVHVSIDGEDVSGWLVLQPNSQLDLERSIKNNNLEKGNKFKFIERTSNIENHRGIGSDDGLVKVEYKFEKIYQYNPWLCQPNYIITTTTPSLGDNTWTTYYNTCQNQNSNQIYAMNCSTSSNPKSDVDNFQKTSAINSSCLRSIDNNINDTGITVPGSISNQKFYNTSDFQCEQSDVIVLKLVGTVGMKKVIEPITVDYKPTCITCGRVNKATNKFCSDCGTSLVII